MPEVMGLCEWKRKVITIDVERHKSDREVRSTLLHEMAHAAASIRGSRGHDPKFFAQLEKLLRLRAPIAIDTPEAGGVRILANLVPSRFPLLKRKPAVVSPSRNSSPSTICPRR
jgi:SprT-like family